MKSSFELIFWALDIKNEPKVFFFYFFNKTYIHYCNYFTKFFVQLATSIGDNNDDNSKKKDDDIPNVGGIGDDQVDNPPNVGQQMLLHRNWII